MLFPYQMDYPDRKYDKNLDKLVEKNKRKYTTDEVYKDEKIVTKKPKENNQH